MVGVPVTMYAYASWRPDANAPSQPTNGTAVIRVDGEDYSGVEFKRWCRGVAFHPRNRGHEGVHRQRRAVLWPVGSERLHRHGACSYVRVWSMTRTRIGGVEEASASRSATRTSLRTRTKHARTWRTVTSGASQTRVDDVCAVYETKKGAVKAKFNGEGKCTVIWLDKESEESGKYTFIAKK